MAADEGTPIGALAVRIGADASALIRELDRSASGLDKIDKAFTRSAKNAAIFAGAAAAAGAAVFAAIKHVSDAADELGKLSQKVGISVESLSALKYSGELANVSLESLGVGLRHLSQQMLEAQQSSGEARETFRALGIEATNGVGGPLRMTEAVLLDLADRFSRMEDGAAKTAIAVRIFGRAGSDLIPVLNLGRAGLAANAEEARKFGIIISTEASKRAEDFNDNLKRLKTSSEGLAIQLAGPLIEALNNSTEAMLNAKNEGEGFFATMLRGWQALAVGTDDERISKQIIEATDNLLALQNDLDAAYNKAKAQPDALFPKLELARLKREVAEAQTELKKLQAIRAVLVPEPTEKKAGGGTEKAPYLRTPDSGNLAAEKQMEAEIERIAQQREAWDAYYAFLRKVGEDTTHELVIDEEGRVTAVREVTRTSAEYEKQLADDRVKILSDNFDREEQMAIEAGRALIEADGLSYSARLEELKNWRSYGETEENKAYAIRLENLSKFNDAELDAIGGRHAAEQRLEREHQDAVNDIRNRSGNKALAMMQAFRDGDLQSATQNLMDLTAGLASGNKRMFELNKIAAEANAAIKGGQAIMAAFAWGAEEGGYIGGIAAAALTAVFVAAQLAAINATEFGGGKGAPSIAGTTAAPPVSPVGTQDTASGRGGQTTILHLHGDTFDQAFIRNLVDKLNENSRDGGRVVVA